MSAPPGDDKTDHPRAREAFPSAPPGDDASDPPHVSEQSVQAPSALPCSSDQASQPLSADPYVGFALASARLRTRARWAGAVLVGSLLLPFEVVDELPLFVWTILGELSPAAAVAALAPAMAGVCVLALSRWVRRSSALAVLVLAVLGANAAVIRLGADAAAWDILPLPDSLTDRPSSAVLAMSAAGAALHLLARAESRVVGRWLLAGSAVCALCFYLWPQCGETPAGTLLRMLLVLPRLPDYRFVLGFGLVLLLLLIPALTVVVTATVMLLRRRREPRLLAPVVTFAMPALLCVLMFRNVLLTFGDLSLLALAAAAMVLASLLALLSGAFEVLGALRAARGRRVEGAGWPTRKSLVVAGAVLVPLLGAQYLLARPAPKGISWELTSPTARAERLFAEFLPRWSRERTADGGAAGRSMGGAGPAVEEAAAQALLEEARAVDAELAVALTALVSASAELDLAGRRWFHLVGDVNEASRRAGLPYYVDPTVRLSPRRQGLQRHFQLSSYRIEQVHPVATSRGPFATLHVRRLTGARGAYSRMLGFSRDVQPFALVVLDEIGPYADELRRWAAARPPTCGGAPGHPGASLQLRCGQLLARLTRSVDLPTAVTRMTERHELQHQMDGPHLPLASELLQVMSAYASDAQTAVNRELSAYLAELTAAAAPPKLGLVQLVRFTFASPRSGLHHLGWLALEAVAGCELRGTDNRFCYEAASRALDELDALDDSALRQRAQQGWEELFHADLPRMEGIDARP
jgi:hypothetical protein